MENLVEAVQVLIPRGAIFGGREQRDGSASGCYSSMLSDGPTRAERTNASLSRSSTEIDGHNKREI
jgi:hypothetical protein